MIRVSDFRSLSSVLRALLRYKADCGMSCRGSVAGPWHSSQGRVNTMINKHFTGILGAAVMTAALSAPGNAQQDVEAKLQVCSACHGANGQPISPGIPIIWGQTEYFLTKQLHDYIS